MRICLVIPTYWTSRSLTVGNQMPVATYDHPTALESESTLPRLLDSLKNVDFPRDSTSIFVTVAATHQAVENGAAERTQKILKEYEDSFNIRQFSTSTLEKMKSEDNSLAGLLSLHGYSNVRNIGLIIAQVLRSDVLYFLDDDVVIDDDTNFQKIQQFVGKTIGGQFIGGVAGYYVDEEGNYYIDVDPRDWWKTGWPKERKMNEAFEVIQGKERLTETTFAFGGCLVLHWKMFEKVPFDPCMSRGEDMDLLANAKMFGYGFLLDRQLKVVHLPGRGKSMWSEMRQDLFRFLYMRKKLLSMNFRVQSLQPYPGHFLLPLTPLGFAGSCFLRSWRSVFEGKPKELIEFQRNIGQIPSAFRYARRHRINYFYFQEKWSRYVPKIRGNSKLKEILESSF